MDFSRRLCARSANTTLAMRESFCRADCDNRCAQNRDCHRARKKEMENFNTGRIRRSRVVRTAYGTSLPVSNAEWLLRTKSASQPEERKTPVFSLREPLDNRARNNIRRDRRALGKMMIECKSVEKRTRIPPCDPSTGGNIKLTGLHVCCELRIVRILSPHASSHAHPFAGHVGAQIRSHPTASKSFFAERSGRTASVAPPGSRFPLPARKP